MTIFKRKRADRVVLRAKFDEAARRLARSVQSIVVDDSVTDKNAMLFRPVNFISAIAFDDL
jgi:hypothetical protein